MTEDMLSADACEDGKAFMAEEVLEEIERQRSAKKSWTSNLTILVITMIIFFQLGLFDRGVTDVLIVIFVILVHEAGHFLAMRIFGYTNVQVFYVAPRAMQTNMNSDSVVQLNETLGNAMDKPEVVVDHLLRVLSGKTDGDFFLGWPEKLFVRLNSVLPGLVDTALGKQLATIKRLAG